MKLTGISFVFCLVVALALTSRPASAAQRVEEQTSDQAFVSGGDMNVVELAANGNPQAPQDKPKKSKKNDGNDGDPDDGNAGGGNDGQTVPKDGPAND